MKGSVLTTRAWVLLIAASLLAVAGALNFQQRWKHKSPPTDGIRWVQTPEGIVAEAVDPESNAGRAGVLGIQPGDVLKAVGVEEDKLEVLYKVEDIPKYFEEVRVGGHLIYLIERPSNPEETRCCWKADIITEEVSTWKTLDVYV